MVLKIEGVTQKPVDSDEVVITQRRSCPLHGTVDFVLDSSGTVYVCPDLDGHHAEGLKHQNKHLNDNIPGRTSGREGHR